MELSYMVMCIAAIAGVVSSNPVLKRQSARSANLQSKLLTASTRKEYNDWAKKRYKIVSFTIGGEMCIDNCDINKTCMTGWEGVRKPCEVGSQPAPIFYTARSHGTQNKATCLTKCGKFGWSYDWCIVGDNNEWDFCSSETNYKKEKTHFSTDGDRCAKLCQLDDTLQKHTCVTVWGAKKECDVEKTVDFVHAKTIYGVPCAGICERRGRSSPYTCYDMNRNNVKCAQPAQMISNTLKHWCEVTKPF